MEPIKNTKIETLSFSKLFKSNLYHQNLTNNRSLSILELIKQEIKIKI